MIRLLLFIVLANYWLPPIYGQNITKKDILNDLTYLNEAVINGHPVNYLQKGQINITEVMNSIHKVTIDSISMMDYRFIVGAALQKIGCVHTSILKNTLLDKVTKTSYFPLNVRVVADKLYVIKQENINFESLEGKEITFINDIPTSFILSTLLQYSASDGGGVAFAARHIQLVMSSLLALYFHYPTQYNIRLNEDFIQIEAATNFVASVLVKNDLQPLSVNEKNWFAIKENIAIIKLQSFYRSDISFLNKVFSEMNDKQTPYLIIDLRGNTGGNRKASVSLTKHLVDTTFSYTILQPTLNTRKYLNGKGKLYLSLSKLKYNVGSIFKSRKTELGRKFTYHYKPDKTTYKGQIYVITDGFTASAATMATSWLKQYSSAVFVGRQAGGGYNGNNGGSFPILTLPHSKIEIQFPAYRLILDPNSNQNAGIIPDFLIDYTIADILKGKDKDVEFIFDYIHKKK